MNIAGSEECVTAMQNGGYKIQFTKHCTLTHLACLAAGLQTLKKLTVFKTFLLYGRVDWIVINYIDT
jgi:hypothetical protein